MCAGPDADRDSSPSPVVEDHPCRFSREEAEVLGTLVSGLMTRRAGSRMMEWAANPKYEGSCIRKFKVRALTAKMVRQYAPKGVMRAEFTEALDGDQRVMFYYRDLYTCVVDLLAKPRFKDRQYTKFRLVQDEQGHRVYGAFNTGDWYRLAQIRAGQSAPGKDVSPVPVFLSNDGTFARKSIGVWPIYCWCQPHLVFKLFWLLT